MSPSVVKIIIKVFTTLAVITAVFYFFINPKLNMLVENQTSLEEIGNKLKIAEDELKQLTKINNDKEGLANTKNIVFNYLPDNADASVFIVTLEQTAKEIPIIIDSLGVVEAKNTTTTPKSTSDSSDTSSDKSVSTTTEVKNTDKSLNFTASLTSTQANILTFLQRMESLNRFNTISNISLGGYDEENGTLSFRLEGKVYYGK